MEPCLVSGQALKKSETVNWGLRRAGDQNSLTEGQLKARRRPVREAAVQILYCSANMGFRAIT